MQNLVHPIELEVLERVRLGTLDLTAHIAQSQLRTSTPSGWSFSPPLLGTLNVPGLLSFAAGHEQRHHEQIREFVGSRASRRLLPDVAQLTLRCARSVSSAAAAC